MHSFPKIKPPPQIEIHVYGPDTALITLQIVLCLYTKQTLFCR